MANSLSSWSVVLLITLATATIGQPTKNKVSFKLETAMEQMRVECEGGKSDSAISCLKYRVLNAIDELFKNDSVEMCMERSGTRKTLRSDRIHPGMPGTHFYKVACLKQTEPVTLDRIQLVQLKISDTVSVVRNSEPVEEARGVMNQLENYVQTHDVLVNLPGESQLRVSSRSIANGELDFNLKFDKEDSVNNVSEARRRKKHKLRKILVPIAVFMVLKALTLIPLFIGVLSLKAWHALHLGFGSFVLSFALAIFQLCKKLAGDSAPPQPIVAHPTGWESQRSFNAGFDAQNFAYNAYASAQ